MTDEPPADRETIHKRFVQLLRKIRRMSPLERCSDECLALIDGFRAQASASMRSGELKKHEWAVLEGALGSAIRKLEFPSPAFLELASFIEKLINRQGTHIPDWREFYAHRAALEQRIRDRGEDESAGSQPRA